MIKLDLHDKTSPLAIRAKECLERWDIQRAAAEGEDGWDVLLSFPSVPEGISIYIPLEPISRSHGQ